MLFLDLVPECQVSFSFAILFRSPVLASSLSILRLRLRELNSDGSLKDVLTLVFEQGFQIGCHVERKSDKSKGQIVAMAPDMIKLEVAGSPGLLASVPTSTFLQGMWTKYTPKPSPTEVSFALASTNATLKIQQKCAAIFQKMCDLTFQHESVASGLLFQIKPQKRTVAIKKFEKGKLILVPVCQKVAFKVGDPAPSNHSNPLLLQVSGFEGVHFWLVPFGNQVKEDTFMAPYYHISQNHEGHNMEIHYQKYDDFKVPIAKNIKLVSEGDLIVLFKEKVPQDAPLLDGETGDSGAAKKRKSAGSSDPGPKKAKV